MAAKKSIVRCAWSEGVDPAYLRYHDEEWGVPVRDDRVHFEFLVLEAAQAGLSWWTILRKREGYRASVRGLRRAKGRALHAAHGRAADAGRQHRAQPAKDRGGDQRTRAAFSPSRKSSARSTGTSGSSSAASRSSTAGVSRATCRRRARNRTRSARISRAAGSSSSARRSCTRTCRPRGSSTITSSAASATRESSAGRR